MTEDGGQPPLGELTVALYAHSEVTGLLQMLTATLADLLPADVITVERHRTVADRVHRRTGTPTALSFTTGDRVLSLRTRADGATEATTTHVVRGVRLSTTIVPVTEWVALLAAELERMAAEDAHTRNALYRFLLGDT